MHAEPTTDPLAGTTHALPDTTSIEEIAEGLRCLGPGLDVWLDAQAPDESEAEQGWGD